MKTVALMLLAASAIAGCGSSASTSSGSLPASVDAPSASSFWGLPDCLQKAGLSVAVGSGKGSYLAVADADANFLVGITYDGSVANAQKAERYKTDNGGQYIAASIGPVDYFWDPNSISESQMSAVTGCLEHTYPNAPTS
jgi:hypothetical protein